MSPRWVSTPPEAGRYRPPIGVIGCGGIIKQHLAAYQNADLSVVALCDVNREAAVSARDRFFPDAEIYTLPTDLLRRDDIEVVDIATHPEHRVELIEQALEAGKHVLSQKPFVLDLDVGSRLVELAERKSRLIAVNQNGRWAPHYRSIRTAIEKGLIGETYAARLSVHWDHTWVEGTAFEHIKHLILYDFAIHWFDIVRCFLPNEKARTVYARTTPARGQTLMPHLLASSLIEFESAQATLSFDASVPFGSLDQTFVSGTAGSAHSSGPDLHRQSVTIQNETGQESAEMKGDWFPDGFQGTMVELLRAIEHGERPEHHAADNLESLALCFAAVASSMTGQPYRPWSVRQLPA